MQPNGGSLKLQEIEIPEEQYTWVYEFLDGVQRGFSYVLFPMLAGIFFGMVVSVVGMLIGKLVVMLWIKFRPTRKIAYERVEDLEKEELPAYVDLEATNENEKA